MALAEEAHRASRLLTDSDYVRAVARLDADGLASSAILAQALQREGLDFHFSFLPSLTPGAVAALQGEKLPLLVLLNLAEDAPALDGIAGEVVAVDAFHHLEDAKGLYPVAPTEAVEATTAAVAQVLACALSRRNSDLEPWALAAAVAEGRHLVPGGLRGLDAELAAEAQESRLVTREKRLALDGATLLDAVSRSVDPFLPGLTGRARAVKKLLQEKGLDPDAPPQGIPEEAARKLANTLVLKQLAANAGAEAVDALFPTRFRFSHEVAGASDARALGDRLLHAAAAGRPSLVLGAAVGDKGSADALAPLAEEGRDKLLQALLRVEREPPAAGPLQVVDAGPAGLAYAGPLARLTHTALADAHRPLAVLAQEGDELHVLLRAARRAPAPRLSLGNAAARAAAAAQGRGGGSPWQARAVVPAAARAAFLAELTPHLVAPVAPEGAP